MKLRRNKKGTDSIKITNLPDKIDIENVGEAVDTIRQNNNEPQVQEKQQRGRCGCFVF